MSITFFVKKILKKFRIYEYIKDNYEKLLNFTKKGERQRFYSQFIQKDDLCFDVGANSGNRTDIFLSLGARVVSIEPQNSCMEKLKRKYRNNKRVFLEKKALGKKKGTGILYLNEADTISSMSQEWIGEINKSHRFSEYQWKNEQRVSIITLEDLIKKYGTPAFCKIDVEGFEDEVLKGLSTPIKYLSFEFASEYIKSSINCMISLMNIGKYKFNYSLGEEMSLVLDEWVSFSEMKKLLKDSAEKDSWGDIYACLIG